MDRLHLITGLFTFNLYHIAPRDSHAHPVFVISTKMNDTAFKSSFPRKNVTPYHDTGRESIFGHCRKPSDLGGTSAHFHPSLCRRQGCMSHSRAQPAPYPDTGETFT